MSPAVMVLWLTAVVALAGYLLLFAAARRPVTLRPGRLAVGSALAGVARLLLVVCGQEVDGYLDGGLIGLTLAAAAGLALARRCWLVRTRADELREQIRRACSGLFLTLEEPAPGRLRIRAKEEQGLRLVGLGRRLQGLVLCKRPEKGKMRLLLDWLMKEYPGPVPRVRITLE